MLIAGVDDAGRGPIIGPLVIAGVLLDDKDVHLLKSLGVKDSKQLSPQRREQLAQEIKDIVIKYHVEHLLPAEIDRVVKSSRKLHKLNRLEAHTMAKVIEALGPDVAYVDASDVLAHRFGVHVSEKLTIRVKVISEHKADITYPIVSSASIIAKVERDREVRELAKRFGDLGSGYMTDPKTVEFLERWLAEHGSYPDFVRKSWRPARVFRANAQSRQLKLS
jgi:ribonuclease HII